jgi:hypothetical protein
MNTAEEQELTTDEALLESISEHKIDDLKLEPFSLLRQSIAADLCDYGGGSMFNAVVTVWVCTLSPTEALEAHTNIPKAKERAFKWAEERGYSLWNWKPIIEMYNRINSEWSASNKARIKQDELDKQEPVPNDGGQLES